MKTFEIIRYLPNRGDSDKIFLVHRNKFVKLFFKKHLKIIFFYINRLSFLHGIIRNFTDYNVTVALNLTNKYANLFPVFLYYKL
jgi:hypothetical protein